MGRRGPPRKTTAENLLNGNPGKRAINKAEPDFEVDEELPCPPDVKGAGREEWERVAPMLVEHGVLRKSDLVTFKNYCETISDLAVYRAKLKKIPSGAIYLKAHMYCQNMIIKLRTQLRHYAQELGLTPASRSAVKATRPKGKRGTQTQAPIGEAQPGKIIGDRSRFFKNKA